MLAYLWAALIGSLPAVAIVMAMGAGAIVLARVANEQALYLLGVLLIIGGLALLVAAGKDALRALLLWRKLGCTDEALEDWHTASREKNGIRLGRRFLFYKGACIEYGGICAMFPEREVRYRAQGLSTSYAILYMETENSSKPFPLLRLEIARQSSPEQIDTLFNRIMKTVAERNAHVRLCKPDL